ncbi:hypothetical protein [Spirobacillus cienkowskii]|uniref:hypothetical protein n=1 Tax=Spirobacillus cienkowskii TaxID=495820 RepID=UPI0030CDC128
MKYSLFIISIFFCNLGFSKTMIYDSLKYPLEFCSHYILASVNGYIQNSQSDLIIPEKEFLGENFYLRKTHYGSYYSLGIVEISTNDKNKCKKNIYTNDPFYIIFKNQIFAKKKYLSISDQNYYYLSENPEKMFTFFMAEKQFENKGTAVYLNYKDNLDNNNFINCVNDYWCRTSPQISALLSLRLIRVSVAKYEKAKEPTNLKNPTKNSTKKPTKNPIQNP